MSTNTNAQFPGEVGRLLLDYSRNYGRHPYQQLHNGPTDSVAGLTIHRGVAVFCARTIHYVSG